MTKGLDKSARNEQILPPQGKGRLLLAMDVGGTKTDYLLATEDRELARVRGGCIKRMRVDAAAAGAHLGEALAALQQRGGRDLGEVAHTCIGTAGETVPLVVEWLRTEVPARVGGQLTVVGDVEIALDAAFQGGPGVLVLAGTGSNVAGRTLAGTLVGAGGWGPQLADQGSGHRIGLNALRAVFLARDEGRSTVLLDRILRFWGLSSLHDLIAYANTTPHPDYSQLSRLTHDCAREGDAVAGEVLRREGEDLGYLVRLVIRRIQDSRPPGHPPAAPPEVGIAFAGSIMENVPLVREALLAHVRTEFGDVRPVEGVVDPVLGALWRARQAVGAGPLTRA